MILSDKQKRIIKFVVQCFETSNPNGGYGVVAITKDGPGKIPQISYGAIQFTEYSSLLSLLKMYVGQPVNIYGAKIDRYLDRFGNIPSLLVNDTHFLQLLRYAGNYDAIMQDCQNNLIEKRYFSPAMFWADINNFTLPLSLLVIFDSYVNSGRIRNDIRAMFKERPPINGGDEQTWIKQYVAARTKWLINNGFKGNLYRMECFEREISCDNWNLDELPIITNGVKVFGD